MRGAGIIFFVLFFFFTLVTKCLQFGTVHVQYVCGGLNSSCSEYGTHCDEGLVEAVEAKVPHEPPGSEGGHVPEVEVGHHQERRTAQHPARQG